MEKLVFLAAKKEPLQLFFAFLDAFWRHFWALFARLWGALFHRFLWGRGGKRSGTGWVPSGAILVSFSCFFVVFFEYDLNLFDPGLVLETKARKKKKRGNSV